ncbi:glycoside hydrolase family 30 protein [Hypholoma sublateritium FD-334 SS-4]|uniref:Glycoside hydrolase family 30 protein n=1 Tax=Hypholoma sublateritium (strain FD-334 SS-4) TaxID=945553 RepID=A0A0D2MMV7_HYPSF|nr:glycoside hydrolase family 30 protein [Hypholoma sublateritium FD-334 SS-4]
MRASLVLISLSFVLPVLSQQIWDIWQTTWDRSKLFTSLAPSSPINFVTPGAIGSADIVVNDGTNTNSANYWALLQSMFTTTDGANAAGLNYIRVPLGASDFSANLYSLDDTSGDTSFSHFNINNIPSYVFSVLKDIQSTNNLIKIHILPWSPPAWMKDSGSMNGGSLQSQYVSVYATYLLKAVQGFQSKGFPIYSISIQNEPQNSNPTYPTCTMTSDVEGQIGTSLRSLLNANGFSAVNIIGYEHNWDDAGAYPVQLMNSYANAFTGVAFHCYAGSVSNQDLFHNAYPSKGLMWNIAADGNGNPKLPGTNSCGGGGCRPMVTVNSDGSYSFNQEFYSMAQASKAVIPKDAGGPYGQRINVAVGGSLGWALRVSAFVTARVSSSDWLRYSIVVMNWDDSASTTWNPQPVTATIEFRGMQATYTFPVGVTTLWWFAPNTGNARRAIWGPRNVTSSEAVKVIASNSTFTNGTRELPA